MYRFLSSRTSHNFLFSPSGSNRNRFPSAFIHSSPTFLARVVPAFCTFPRVTLLVVRETVFFADCFRRDEGGGEEVVAGGGEEGSWNSPSMRSDSSAAALDRTRFARNRISSRSSSLGSSSSSSSTSESAFRSRSSSTSSSLDSSTSSISRFPVGLSCDAVRAFFPLVVAFDLRLRDIRVDPSEERDRARRFLLPDWPTSSELVEESSDSASEVARDFCQGGECRRDRLAGRSVPESSNE